MIKLLTFGILLYLGYRIFISKPDIHRTTDIDNQTAHGVKEAEYIEYEEID